VEGNSQGGKVRWFLLNIIMNRYNSIDIYYYYVGCMFVYICEWVVREGVLIWGDCCLLFGVENPVKVYIFFLLACVAPFSLSPGRLTEKFNVGGVSKGDDDGGDDDEATVKVSCHHLSL